MVKVITDNWVYLDFVKDWSGQVSLVCFGMGELGMISRTLAPLYGAAFTFTSLTAGEATAPGQPTFDEMRQIYKFLGVFRWDS
jgi:3-dehydroquinate dehydratase